LPKFLSRRPDTSLCTRTRSGKSRRRRRGAERGTRSIRWPGRVHAGARARARPGIRKTMQTAIAIYYSSNKGQELRQWVRREGSKLSRAAVGALVKRDASAKTSPSSRLDRSTIAPRRVEEGHSVRSRGLTNNSSLSRSLSSRAPRDSSERHRRCFAGRCVVGAPIFGSKTCSFLEKVESQETQEISRNALPDSYIYIYILFIYTMSVVKFARFSRSRRLEDRDKERKQLFLGRAAEASRAIELYGESRMNRGNI